MMKCKTLLVSILNGCIAVCVSLCVRDCETNPYVLLQHVEIHFILLIQWLTTHLQNTHAHTGKDTDTHTHTHTIVKAG